MFGGRPSDTRQSKIARVCEPDPEALCVRNGKCSCEPVSPSWFHSGLSGSHLLWLMSTGLGPVTDDLFGGKGSCAFEISCGDSSHLIKYHCITACSLRSVFLYSSDTLYIVQILLYIVQSMAGLPTDKEAQAHNNLDVFSLFYLFFVFSMYFMRLKLFGACFSTQVLSREDCGSARAWLVGAALDPIVSARARCASWGCSEALLKREADRH